MHTDISNELLLHLQQRLQSIVMSMSVCLSVLKNISGTTHTIFTKFFVHVAYVPGSVLLWHVDNRPHRMSAGRGYRSAQHGRSVIYDCLVNIC